ncbi:nuclear transport factor 2 family protein [Nocardia asiatica]|uniref:nuclear transport factor 2 family protein n=1 Tax=Nocardia asiatica TaxID=209252 RepID=UPI0002DC87EE|nr:nuclear transport factor 2 family protein [Nocardia asiatica]
MTQSTETDRTYGGRPDAELTKEQIIDRNLHVVEDHFHNENPESVEKAVALYANQISWEAPTRGVIMNDRDAILDAYRGIFRTIRYRRTTSLRRFATEKFVFDDQIGEVTVVGEEMPNLPYHPGTEVNCRLVHLFELKDGKITNEIAYEMWREAGSPVAVDFVPEGSHVKVFDA